MFDGFSELDRGKSIIKMLMNIFSERKNCFLDHSAKSSLLLVPSIKCWRSAVER